MNTDLKNNSMITNVKRTKISNFFIGMILLCILFGFESKAQTTQSEVLDFIVNVFLDGNCDSIQVSMTNQAYDTTFVARDILDNSNIPFPFEKTWLVMIDALPNANWTHPVQWLFIKDDFTDFEFRAKNIPPAVLGNYGNTFEEEFFDCVNSGGCLCSAYVPLVIPDPEVGKEEDCLKAVLMSGGMNRKLNNGWYKDNLKRMYKHLREAGCKKDNIYVYYADGKQKIDYDGGDIVKGKASEASDKIKELCNNAKANPQKDVLFIYISNHGDIDKAKPKNNDGIVFLWDENGNHNFTEDAEIYREKKFSTDTKNCKACRVFVVMDQCHSGAFIDVAKDGDHKNMAIYTAAAADQLSYGSQYLDFWLKNKIEDSKMDEMHKNSEKNMGLNFMPKMEDKCLYGIKDIGAFFTDKCDKDEDCSTFYLKYNSKKEAVTEFNEKKEDLKINDKKVESIHGPITGKCYNAYSSQPQMAEGTPGNGNVSAAKCWEDIKVTPVPPVWGGDPNLFYLDVTGGNPLPNYQFDIYICDNPSDELPSPEFDEDNKPFLPDMSLLEKNYQPNKTDENRYCFNLPFGIYYILITDCNGRATVYCANVSPEPIPPLEMNIEAQMSLNCTHKRVCLRVKSGTPEYMFQPFVCPEGEFDFPEPDFQDGVPNVPNMTPFNNYTREPNDNAAPNLFYFQLPKQNDYYMLGWGALGCWEWECIQIEKDPPNPETCLDISEISVKPNDPKGLKNNAYGDVIGDHYVAKHWLFRCDGPPVNPKDIIPKFDEECNPSIEGMDLLPDPKFLWTGKTFCIENLISGRYYLLVMDDRKNTAVECFVVPEPLTVEEEPQIPVWNADSNVYIWVNGGEPNYNFKVYVCPDDFNQNLQPEIPAESEPYLPNMQLWEGDFGPQQTEPNRYCFNLPPGRYYILVYDSRCRAVVHCTEIIAPPPFVMNIDEVVPFDCNNMRVYIRVKSGTSKYMFQPYICPEGEFDFPEPYFENGQPYVPGNMSPFYDYEMFKDDESRFCFALPKQNDYYILGWGALGCWEWLCIDLEQEEEPECPPNQVYNPEICECAQADPCIFPPTCNDNPCRGDIETQDPINCECVVVEPQVLGCTTPVATNYNPNANCNDGSCIFPPVDINFITQINNIQCAKAGDTICINLIAKNEVVDGIKGIDYEITYLNQFLRPTGKIILGEVVENGGKGAGLVNTELADDRLRVSIYYAGDVGTETLTGKGQIACVEFVFIGKPITGTYDNIGTDEVELSFENKVKFEPCALTSLQIKSNQPPTISCPNDTITLQLNENNEAFLDEPIATDDCEIVSRQLSKQKFNCEDAGKTHQVTFIVTDDEGLETICDIMVYIAPPNLVIICPDDEFTPSFDDSGIHSFSPQDFGFPLVDVCDEPLNYTFNPASITCTETNIEYVEVTVTDGYNQTAECLIKIRWEIQQANVRVVYWPDERPIGSDEIHDTNITFCGNEDAVKKVDEQGKADILLLNPDVQFDVFRTKACKAVQDVINAQDAKETAQIAAKFPFLSNSFKFLAADYNDDGVVSAGDATHILDMAVGKICPDKKLWQFQKKEVFAGAEFQLDSGFPNNDDVGIDRADVAKIPKCFKLENDECEPFKEVVIYGILKGDVDGSWQKKSGYKTSPKKNKHCGVKLDFDDLTNTAEGNFILPLSFNADGLSSAFDVDISFNEPEVNIVSVTLSDFVNSKNAAMAWNYIEKENRLLISAFTLNSIEMTEPLFLVEIETASEPTESIVASFKSFLEGKDCNIISINEIEENKFNIHPNPNKGSFQIKLEKPLLNALVEVIDAAGKVHYQNLVTNPSSIFKLNLPQVKPGIYFVKVTNEDSFGIKKVVVY